MPVLMENYVSILAFIA